MSKRANRLPVLLLAAALCAAIAGCAEKSLKLECMERYNIDSYRVGCWLWGDHRKGGGPYEDEDFEKVTAAGFNTFIGAGVDLKLLNEHGLKIMDGASRSQLPQLIALHKKYGDRTEILGYHLNDNCDLHDYTVRCAQWLEANDAAKLAWMSTSPNPVGQAGVPMPAISSQIYTFTQRPGSSQEDVRTWFCNTLDRDRAHCNRYDMAMWPIIGAYGQHESPSQYRFQANAAVAYGAQSFWLFCYNRYFRPVLSPAAGPVNKYIANVAGPRVLGRRSVRVFHSGPDLPPESARPGPGKLIRTMDDYLLAGVLVPDAEFQAGIDAPDTVMVVDKRTIQSKLGAKLASWTGGHSDAERPRPRWFAPTLRELYTKEDPGPRRAHIEFGDRVTAVEALLPNGRTIRYNLDMSRSLELPALRGGGGILLRIEAAPQKADAVGANPVVNTLPNYWKFKLDRTKALGDKERWFDPDFDADKWERIFVDKYCGWTYQGHGRASGDGWYRFRLQAPKEMRRPYVYLHFGAADEEAWVYIDGKLVYEHTQKSTRLGIGQLWFRPFFFECRETLADGMPHTVVVRVRNWHGVGGLYQPIHSIGSDKPLNREQLWRLVRRHRKREQELRDKARR